MLQNVKIHVSVTLSLMDGIYLAVSARLVK